MILSYVFLLLSGTCSAAASIFLRIAGQEIVPHDMTIAGLPQSLVLRLFAVGAYGLGFLLYAASLKKLELGVAYPMMVTITLLELFVYNAIAGGITLRMAFGALLLVCGLFLLAPATSGTTAQSQ
jgi:multidrug transporter EmrE-like cation transporter